MTECSHGYLITLEGGEGAGKTTAAAMIRDWLMAKGREVVMTREPGGTPLAERIRAVLLDPEVKAMSPTTELLLMFAARSENLDQLIRPALAKGQDVVCDRFTDASRAYQGAGRGLGLARVDLLAEVVHGDLSPDLTLLLDVPVGLGMERVGQRGDKLNRFELAEQAFFERVRQGYLDQAAKEPQRFCIINAAQSLSEVQADILVALENRLTGLA